MRTSRLPDVSRRERQALDVIYRLGAASAADVQRAIPDPPGYSAVRAMLATLVRKGHLRVERQGTRYLYHPTIAPEAARTRALRHVVDTFFAAARAGGLGHA